MPSLEYKRGEVILHIKEREFLEMFDGIKQSLVIPEISPTDDRKMLVVIDYEQEGNQDALALKRQKAIKHLTRKNGSEEDRGPDDTGIGGDSLVERRREERAGASGGQGNIQYGHISKG